MSPGRRFTLAVGLVLVVAYAVVAALTIRVSGRHVRPLFEGVGPAPAYQWVNPPPEFAAANLKPRPTDSNVALAAAGSQASGVSTDDGQLILNLPDGAFAAHGTDDTVRVHITPIDPATLAKLPSDLRPDGNTYRVQADYPRSHQAVEALDKPGNVIVRVPEPFSTLLYSRDGVTWERLDANPVGTTSIAGAVLSKLGYYLGAAQVSTAPPQRKGGGSNGGVLLIAAATTALALALGLGPFVFRRVRRDGRRGHGRRLGGRQSRAGAKKERR